MTEAVAQAAVGPLHQRPDRALCDAVRLFLVHWRASLMSLVTITVAVVAIGHSYVPSQSWLVWAVLAGINTLGQAAICRAMERAPSVEEAVQRWLRPLVANIALNSVLWGMVPIIVRAAATPVLVFSCVFSVMLMFCLANARGTRGMLLCGSIPLGVLCIAALLLAGLPWYAWAGFGSLAIIIVVHGLRMQAALQAGLQQQYAAEDMAVELRAQQQRLVELERERTLLLERRRLTRDMHDGLGSALVSSLAAVERGEVRPQQLASMLRDCMDDLRAVIDSLEPADQDLVAVLAMLRFRLEPRLDAAGVKLHWRMDDLPELAWMGAPEALHVMRIVQEVLANVVRHAGARRVEVSARLVDGCIHVCLADDGVGFDPAAAASGRGLPSLHQRAAALGGSIDIDAGAGRGTRVLLRLPVARV